MDILCTADMCPVILNSTCVFYEGNTLTYTGITQNDSIQTALQKIDAKFGDSHVGYIFTNGVVQLSPGQPVKLGGSLIENTTIGGNFTLSFVGPIIGSKLATAGGTASQFLKGDGTLDNTPYQVAGAYITNLSGDVVASGPGTAVATLASVNSNPGIYGDGTHVPRITVDSKGRVTAVTSTAISLPSSVLSFTGDVYGSGSTGSTTTLTLNDVNLNVYNSNTFLKFKVNAKGLVTGATPVTGLDINSALGFTPVPNTRTITINGVTQTLQADRSWTLPGGGSVTNVSATAGTGISVSVTNPATTPNITITNTAPDQVVSIAAGTGINVTGSYPNFTVAATNTGSVTDVTASSPLASSGGATPNITISQASGSTNGYLSSTDWTTFNSKQAAGNYITALTGEATASGPGSATVTLSNAAVTGKVLTGVNITGGTVVATDTILEAFGKVQNQINSLIGGTIYQGVWDAATNTPTLTSSVGVDGHYYITNVYGTTNLNGINEWHVGDWAIFHDGAWQKVDNTDAVVSVNGQTGAVSLTTDNISEGSTNLYYTPSRARTAISLTTSGSAGAATYNSTTGVLNIPIYITTGAQTFAGSKTFSSTLFGAGAQFTGNVVVTGPVFQTDGPSTYIANGGNQNNTVYIAGSPLNSGFTRDVYIASNGNPGSSTNLYLGVNATGTINNIYIGSTDFTAVTAKGNWLFDDVLPISSTGGYSVPGGTSSEYLMADGSTSTGPDLSGYVPTSRTLTINGTTYDLTADRSWTIAASGGTVTSVSASVPTGFDISGSPITTSGTLAITFASGYSLPTTASQTNWDTAYTNRITSLTTTGSSGAATLISNTLNIPTYTLAGLGGQPLSTNLTSLSGLAYVSESFVKMTGANTFALDTTAYYPASNPNGYTSNTGTVTSVAALTIGTTGTDLSSSVATGTTTPVITLNVPTASASNRGALSATDWTTFNNKVSTSRTLTINGTTFDLSADRSWTIPTGTVLNGTGFVKASGTTISYDNSTYVSTTGTGATGTWSISISGSAGSVAWANVSSKPQDWLNQATLTSSNAPNTAVPSGFYQDIGGAGNPTGTWMNYVNVRHNNTGNVHGFQAGMSYYDNNFWVRSYQGMGTYQNWNRLLGTTTDLFPANMDQYVRTSDFVRHAGLQIFSSNTSEPAAGMRMISHSVNKVGSTKFIKINAGTNNYFTGFIYGMNFDNFPPNSTTNTGSGQAYQFGGWSDGSGACGDKYFDLLWFGGNNVGGFNREMNTDGNGYIITALTSTGAGGFKASATVIIFARDMSKLSFTYY